MQGIRAATWKIDQQRPAAHFIQISPEVRVAEFGINQPPTMAECSEPLTTGRNPNFSLDLWDVLLKTTVVVPGVKHVPCVDLASLNPNEQLLGKRIKLRRQQVVCHFVSKPRIY